MKTEEEIKRFVEELNAPSAESITPPDTRTECAEMILNLMRKINEDDYRKHGENPLHHMEALCKGAETINKLSKRDDAKAMFNDLVTRLESLDSIKPAPIATHGSNEEQPSSSPNKE